MDHDGVDPAATTDGDPSRDRARRGARVINALAAALLAVVALVGAGCASASHSPGVAHLGSTATTAGGSSPAGSVKDRALAYSKCMRSHGITDFPDPNSDGGVALTVDGPTSDLAPDNPQFQAAQTACKAWAPTDGGGLSPAKQAEVKAQTLKYSQCMREHGIRSFPDPNAGGGLEIKGTPGGELDPDAPRYQSADKACKHLLPGGGKGGQLNKHLG